MSHVLIALALAALAIGLRALASGRSTGERAQWAERSLIERFTRLPATSVPLVRAILLGVGVASIALASRSDGAEARRTDPEGSETILLLDASNSMLAADMEPSRLQAQRDLAARLATRTEGRLGVVYFAGRAYVLSPLTTDISAVEMLVEGVRPAAVGLGGSSIASGLTQSIDLLAGGDDAARKTIVLFSDGEETSGQPLSDALDRARDAGIVVHTIGFGTEAGGQIPLTRDASLDPATAARRRGGNAVLQDADGNPVVTRLEEASLREIASATGGRYVRASDGASAIERRLASRSDDPVGATNDVWVGALLLLAFVSLWGEGFVFPRG